MSKDLEIIKDKCDRENFEKIVKIENNYLFKFIAKFINLLNPGSVFVCNNSIEDFDYIRKKALKDGEEKKVKQPIIDGERHGKYFKI